MSYKQKTKTWKPYFASEQEFIFYLKHTLIPDIKQSGNNETAHDFEEAIYWLNQNNPDEL